MKKKIAFCCLLIYLLEVFGFSVYAYRSSPFLNVQATLEDIPQNTAYIDLLLPVQEKDPYFVPQKDELDAVYNIFDYSRVELPNDCEISKYNDAYYSYYFHFEKSTISAFPVGNDDSIYINYGENQKLLEDYLLKIDSFKLAFVDVQGNIIQMSDSVSVKSSLTKSFSYLKIVNGEVFEEYIDMPLSRFAVLLLPLGIIIGIGIAVIRAVRIEIQLRKVKREGTVSRS